MDPLVNVFIVTNDICQTFRSSAITMAVLDNNLNVDRTHAHQQHGHTSMGYNAATMVIQCDV